MAEEKTLYELIRARNNVFYAMLYKDITHEQLVNLFEIEFGITAFQMNKTLVSDGKSSDTQLIKKNEDLCELIKKKKNNL